MSRYVVDSGFCCNRDENRSTVIELGVLQYNLVHISTIVVIATDFVFDGN